ncbi:MAG: hypothetical protein GF331_03920 [Chitinivibrionales bacterium]|nr:hypothetical protein [Chitinivibrionales bacterium]
MRRLFKLTAAAACAVALMVGCSDDGDGDSGTSPTPVDPPEVVGVWVGVLNLGDMALDVTADLDADSSYSIAAMLATTPMFTSVGSYTVESSSVIFMGDTCKMVDDNMVLGEVPCTDDTVTVDGDTLRYSYSYQGYDIPIGLGRQP